MTEAQPPDNRSSDNAARGSSSMVVRRNRALRFMGALALAVLVTGGCFFVGRRIYYRMIQPAPLWTVSTPKTERIVCDAGLTVQLWADETLVHNPTSLSVDARGRVWVSEAVNYRDWQNHQRQTGQIHQDAGDCIVILDDTDGDGRADSRTVFVQDPDLVSPTGVCVLGNRVFVSCSPSIYIYIDDDGDDRADRRETLLTGFGGHDHDHGVHSVVPGPDGRLYFAVGNAGPHIVTDKDGWTLRAGSLHQWIPENSGTSTAPASDSALNMGGLISDDGRTYVGGLVLSVNPDGSGLQVHSHNARNPYEICVDSLGDIWQTDNDDTSSCRMTWLMKGASTGFTSADGNRSWQADQRPGQSTEVAHWHQDDPGVLPAGDVYGTGAPTGLVRYEGHELGASLHGAILACDAGLGCVFAFHPVSQGAGFTFRRSKIIWSEPLNVGNRERPDGLALTWFRPTDVAIAPNGHVFVADWYDSYVGAHRVNDFAADGRIYVVRPETSVVKSQDSVDEEQPENKLTADPDRVSASLQSDVPEIRWTGRQHVADDPENALPALQELLKSPDPFLQARALFALPGTGSAGTMLVRDKLTSHQSEIKVAAFRSLLSAGESALSLVNVVAGDPAPAVRREAMIALRGLPLEDSRPLFIQLAAQLDGDDRFEVEAFGTGCEGHEQQIYPDLKLRFGADVSHWSPAFSMLAWRLHPESALEDLKERLANPETTSAEKRRILDALSFVPDSMAAVALTEFAAATFKNPAHAPAEDDLQQYAAWWRTRLEEKQTNPASRSATTSRLQVRYQPAAPRPVDHQHIEKICELDGVALRGRELFHSKPANCGQCHRVQDRGGDLGPDLTQIARRLTRQQLVEAILYPGNSVLTGYELWTIVDKQGLVDSGLLQSAGAAFVLRNVDAKRISIPQSEIEELIRQSSSLMPENTASALNDQQLADLVEFLSEIHK